MLFVGSGVLLGEMKEKDDSKDCSNSLKIYRELTLHQRMRGDVRDEKGIYRVRRRRKVREMYGGG